MRRGINLIKQAYNKLQQDLNRDLAIIVEAGSVGLMAGDEHDIGPNIPDMLNLFSLDASGIDSIYAVLGLGADRTFGVSDAASLRAISELTELNGFLGTISLHNRMP